MKTLKNHPHENSIAHINNEHPYPPVYSSHNSIENFQHPWSDNISPDFPLQAQLDIKVLHNLLEWFVYTLEENHEYLYAAIIQPLSTNSFMQIVTSVNIPLEHIQKYHQFNAGVFTHNVKKLGKKRYKSIAGKCATLKRPIYILDMDDKDTEHIEDFVVLDPSRVGEAIISVPVLSNVDKEIRALAVVSISSTVKGFLTREHVSRAEEFANYLRPFVEHFIESSKSYTNKEYIGNTVYDTWVMVEQPPSEPSHQLSSSTDVDFDINPILNICAELIKELRENWRITAHPTKQELVINKLLEKLPETLDFDDIVTLFSDEDDPIAAAETSLYKLNRKFQKRGYELKIPRRYTITPLKERPQRQ